MAFGTLLEPIRPLTLTVPFSSCCLLILNLLIIPPTSILIPPHPVYPVAEFKEFERRFKFKPRFKYGWFHLKLYQMFQDLSRRLI